MPYTLLRMTEAGVVLWGYHLRRLGLTDRSAGWEAFAAFGREAEPGVWAVWVDGSGRIRVQARSGTRLRDGMPVRTRPSPIADRVGRIPKPDPPGPYHPERLEGTATLLTSPDGAEIYEACSAAVVGWDGSRIICSPEDRPRVWSTAEMAIREHLPVQEAPIRLRAMPLLLVNAVKGTCGLDPKVGGDFPAQARQTIEEVLCSLTKRPGDARGVLPAS